MAQGIEFAYNEVRVAPDAAWYQVYDGTNAATLRFGELVCNRIVSGVQSLGIIQLPATSGYSIALAANGVLGVVEHPIKLDSSGNLVQSVPTNVSAAAVPIYGLPSAAAGIAADADGKFQTKVSLFSPTNVFKARFAPSTAVVADRNIIGLQVGLLLGTGGVGNGKWVLDNGATIKPFIIVGIDEKDPNFNASCDGDTTPYTSCLVYFKALPTFQQAYGGPSTPYYTV